MHQITACIRYKLLKAAYSDYCNEATESIEEILSFDTWCESHKAQSPQLKFWNLVLSMELVIFLLIRSFGEVNFSLYCQSVVELIPYFLANNNSNYAPHSPQRHEELQALQQKHPQVAREFHSRKFVVHKSSREFSTIALDHCC